MKTIGIIPARYASTRFPGKPLVDIFGKSMIQRVYEQALKAETLDHVIVATDDQQIFDHVNQFGGEVTMTSNSHNSGTSRCLEVVEKQFNYNFDLVINIQGDEPFIDPQQINMVVKLFEDEKTEIATLVKKISKTEEIFNPNVVKAIIAKGNKVIYFSRSPVPFFRGVPQDKWIQKGIFYKHIGIYGYRTEVLKKINSLSESYLEKAESLEQLRWLENGFSIFSTVSDFEGISIDTPEDLQKVIKTFRNK